MHDGDVDRGGSGAGYLFLGDGPEAGPAPKPVIAEAIPVPPAVPAIEKPPLSLPPAKPAAPPQIAMNEISPPVMDPSIIGIPSGVDRLGTVRVSETAASRGGAGGGDRVTDCGAVAGADFGVADSGENVQEPGDGGAGGISYAVDAGSG